MDTIAQIQARAREVQAKHQENLDLLARVGGSNPSSDLLREIQGEVETLQQGWTHYYMDQFGKAPMYWDPLDPAQAIVIAVRGDLNDTVNRLRFKRDSRSLNTAFEKLEASYKLFDNVGAAMPNLPKWGVLEWVTLAAGVVAILMFFRSRD